MAEERNSPLLRMDSLRKTLGHGTAAAEVQRCSNFLLEEGGVVGMRVKSASERPCLPCEGARKSS